MLPEVGDHQLRAVHPVHAAEVVVRLGEDGEVVEHNVRRSGLQAAGPWSRIDRGFRFRIPGWGSVPWKRVLTEMRLVNYDYVLSYEHEDVVMSRDDGMEKTIEYLRPLIIKGRYEGRGDKLFE